MKNKAFTLIELLAVIIILGILMLIAIPSVTNYINNSRKSTYVTTINELLKGTINKINSGELNLLDTDTTYYVPCTCIKLENGEAKSPYGKFDPAYVVVTFDGTNYHYYFTGKDVQNMGVPVLTSSDVLSKESIVANVSSIDTSVGIEGTSNVYVFSDECNGEGEIGPVGTTVSGVGSSENGENANESGCKGNNCICKKATSLHTTICQANCTAIECGCGVNIGYGNTITYGTIPDEEQKSGDAYDCDVNKDGKYNSENERFYYLTSDGDESTLIYYKNMNDQATYEYDSSGYNYYGPRTSYQYLPNLSEWKNSKIIAPGTRNIKNVEGGNTTNNGSDTIQPFTYTNKAARFITNNEMKIACNIETQIMIGSLSECDWLLENIGWYEARSGSKGYWIENPAAFSNTKAIASHADYRSDCNTGAGNSVNFGVRPVITVKTSDIEQ